MPPKKTTDQADVKTKTTKTKTKAVVKSKKSVPKDSTLVDTPENDPNLPNLPSSTFDHFKRDGINNALSFQINNVELGIVNALRRIIISEIPNVGIEFDPYDDEKSDIRFIENTSSLHNEFLGHRLSMTPIKLDEYEIENFEKSKYNFEINKHNTSKDKLAVTTDDIHITDEYGEEKDRAFHEKVFPRSPITGDPILIVILNENSYNPEFGEKLHVRFRSSIGTGQKHSRYIPVSTCAYHNVVDEEKAKKAQELYVKARQSEQVNTLLTKKNKEYDEGQKEGEEDERAGEKGKGQKGTDGVTEESSTKILKKRFDVHDRYRHFMTNEFDEPSAFSFTLECESRLSERYLVKKGFEVLISKLQNIVRESRFKVSPLGKDAFSILIKGEQHTMGNLLQVLLYDIYVRGEKKELDYVGYYLVHPLVEEIIVKLKFSNGVSPTSIDYCNRFLVESVKKMEGILENLKSEWEKAWDRNMNVV